MPSHRSDTEDLLSYPLPV